MTSDYRLVYKPKHFITYNFIIVFSHTVLHIFYCTIASTEHICARNLYCINAVDIVTDMF